MPSSSRFKNECPYLPKVGKVYKASALIDHKATIKGEALLHYRLCYAQSCLNGEKPAQAILQLNHALALPLRQNAFSRAGVLVKQNPYYALKWILETHQTRDGFMGNPVRHFQHLATRMPAGRPLGHLRVQRAWVCYWLSKKLLPENIYPSDKRQIKQETLAIPSLNETLSCAPLNEHDAEIQVITNLFQSST